MSGFLEVLHRLVEDGVFVGHVRSIRTRIIRSPDCFAFPREREDIVAAIAAGRHKVEVEAFDFSHGLFADGINVASFAKGRIGYREWAGRNGRLGDIHSIDDRLDHDIDELMA